MLTTLPPHPHPRDVHVNVVQHGAEQVRDAVEVPAAASVTPSLRVHGVEVGPILHLRTGRKLSHASTTPPRGGGGGAKEAGWGQLVRGITLVIARSVHVAYRSSLPTQPSHTKQLTRKELRLLPAAVACVEAERTTPTELSARSPARQGRTTRYTCFNSQVARVHITR